MPRQSRSASSQTASGISLSSHLIRQNSPISISTSGTSSVLVGSSGGAGRVVGGAGGVSANNIGYFGKDDNTASRDDLNRMYDDIGNKIEKLLSKIEYQTKKTNEQQKKIDKQSAAIVNHTQEIAAQKGDLLLLLAVFVSIFTFISIEVQIFRTPLNFYAVAGVTLLLFSALTFFCLLIAYLLRINTRLALHDQKEMGTRKLTVLDKIQKWFVCHYREVILFGFIFITGVVGVWLLAWKGNIKSEPADYDAYQERRLQLQQTESEYQRKFADLEQENTELKQRIDRLETLLLTQSTSRPQN